MGTRTQARMAATDDEIAKWHNGQVSVEQWA
jgi:hypothetical protein